MQCNPVTGQHLHCETWGKNRSISISKCTNLAADVKCGIYRKFKQTSSFVHLCMHLLTKLISGDICNSTYFRFSVRRSCESQFILSFFLFLGNVWFWCILGNCLKVRQLKNLSICSMHQKLPICNVLFAVSHLPKCWHFLGREPSQKPALISITEKEDIAPIFPLLHLNIMHWKLRGWQEWVSVPNSAKSQSFQDIFWV